MFPPGPGRFARVMDHADTTCEKPYHTPWGVRCNNLGHDHRSNLFGPFAVRGHWLQDRVSGKCMSCQVLGPRHFSPCYKPNRITTPKRDLFEANFDLMDPIFDLAERTDTHDNETKQSQSRCLITELPYEILRQILDYIVPSGCVYQFIPSKQESRPTQIVQRFISSSDHYPSVVELAIAATCRTLQQRICEVLYGENEFILNIAVDSLIVLSAFKPSVRFESWSRLLCQPPGPLASITARTAPFLKSVSLLIVFPHEDKEWQADELHGKLSTLVEILEHCKQLHRLTIDFQVPTPASPGGGKARHVDRLQVDFDETTRKWNIQVSKYTSVLPRR